MRKLTIIAVAAAALLTGCMSRQEQEARARDALTAQGYTAVRITGSRWYGCAESDHFAQGFEARSIVGAPVAGVVCWGLGKGTTIRTD